MEDNRKETLQTLPWFRCGFWTRAKLQLMGLRDMGSRSYVYWSSGPPPLPWLEEQTFGTPTTFAPSSYLQHVQTVMDCYCYHVPKEFSTARHRVHAVRTYTWDPVPGIKTGFSYIFLFAFCVVHSCCFETRISGFCCARESFCPRNLQMQLLSRSIDLAHGRY